MSFRDKIINGFVSVYGEEHRERIEKRTNECKVLITYNDKYETQNRFIDREIAKITDKFFSDNNLDEINHANYDKLREINLIAGNCKNGDISCAEELVKRRLCLRFKKVLNLPEDYIFYTKEEEVKYISENIEGIVETTEGIENLWERSEVSTLIAEKCEKANKNSAKSTDIDMNIRKISKEIETIVKQHLETLAKDNIEITSSQIKDFLFLLDCDPGSSFFKDIGKKHFEEFCIDLGFKFNDFDKFLRTELIESKIFSTEIIDKIQKHQMERENLRISKTSLEANINKLNNMEIANGNKGIIDNLFDFVSDRESTLGYAQAYVDSKTRDVKHVVVLPEECDSATVVHEFGHEIQTQILEQDEKVVVYRTGLVVDYKVIGGDNYKSLDEVVNDRLTPPSKKNLSIDLSLHKHISTRYKRLINEDLTPLNEALNEYFTFEAVEHENLNNSSKSLYQNAFYMLQDFINKYKPEIVKCLMGGDLLEFVDFIGEDNLVALNKNVKNLYDRPKLHDSAKKLEKIANSKGVKIEDLFKDVEIENKIEYSDEELADLSARVGISENLDKYDLRYLKLLLKTNNIINKIDDHIESQRSESDKEL